MVKTKRILIALAVIGTNMLYNMPVYTSLAADYTVTHGTDSFEPSSGSSSYASVVGNQKISSADLTGWEMVIRNGTYNHDSSYYPNPAVILVKSDIAAANIKNNNLTINDGTFNYYIYGVKYDGTDVESVISNNNTTLNDGTYNYGVYGVYAKNGKVKENTLTIEGGTFKWGNSNNISAGWVESYGCVEANKVFINGGDIQYSKDIYGGYMRGTGDAIDNEVTISGGTVGSTDNWIGVYGAEVYYGSATGNKVNIDGGSFGKGCGFYGAYLLKEQSTAYISGNEVNITGGTFNYGVSVYGGYVHDNANCKSVENNQVTIKNVTLPADSAIYGGYAKNVTVKGNGVTIENATLGENVQIYGGLNSDNRSAGALEDGNWVKVNNATFNSGTDNKIFGGSATGDGRKAMCNTVTIENGTFTAATGDFGIEIVGGYARKKGTDSSNTVTINDGNFTATGTGAIIIAGGSSDNTDEGGDGSNSDNTVKISGGIFQGVAGGTPSSYIYGAREKSANNLRNIKGNQVILEGGIFKNISIVAAEGNGTTTTTGNSITLMGSNALDLSGATLMGYETNGDNNRTLNVERTNVAVKDIKNFGTIDFDLSGVSSDAVVLKMQNTLNLSSWNVANITVSGITLDDDDYITLMQNVSSTGFADTGSIKILDVGGGKYDLVYYNGMVTPKADYTIKNGAGEVKKEESSGTYNSAIKGNESTNEYSNNSIVIRRGTYNTYIMYGALYTNTDTITMDNNSITIHSGTFNIGLYAAGANGTGNFTGNTITINDGIFADGTVRNIYTVIDTYGGSATNNSIVINGGNLGSKKSIGAADVHGQATGNIVAINGGTFGATAADASINIYGVYLDGGFSNTISENKVNINAGSFAGTMDIAGVYVTTNAGANTYNYNKVNISGGSFDLIYVDNGKINIYGIYRNGSVTAANYNSVVIANAQFNLNEVNDDVNVYGASVGSGNVEYNSVELHDGKFNQAFGGRITNNGNANYNVLTIKGGTFDSGSGTEIYGGYVGGNGKVEGNKLIISGGDVGKSKMIYAGYIGGDGDAIDNEITISGGTVGNTSNWITIFGAKVNSGNATGNKVNITGGWVGNYGNIYGAQLEQNNPDASISENEVNITGGTFDYKINIYGGYASSGTAKKAENNKVTIKNISVANDSTIYGGNATDTLVKENGVIIENATLSDSIVIYGGYTESKDAEGNFVTLKSSTFGDGTQIYGAYTNNGNAGGDTEDKGNKVIIDGGSFGVNGQIYGAWVETSGDVLNNKIIIKDGTFAGGSSGIMYFNAGCSFTSGNAKGNSIVIEKGTFGDNCDFEAGYAGSGDASDNYLIITDGTFGNDTTFYGGYSYGGGTADNNIVEIAGGTFGNNFGLYGGYTTGTSTNNTLNLKIKMGGKASEVSHFQNMNFTLPSNITNGDVMLKTENLAVDGSGGEATINVNAAKGVKLKAGDVITLVDVGSTIADNFVAGDILGGAAELCVERDDAEDKNEDTDQLDLVITLLRDYGSGGDEDQQKAPVEGIAAAVQIVNQSADLASGQGMASLIAETAGGVTNTFGALTAGQSKYKTGSHVDIDGWGLLVGAGKTKEWGNGEATTLGVFFEYGKGDFDTYNGNVHGDGNSKNQGIGIMMRHKMLNNTYYEGNIRYGKQKTEWSESELGSYDTDSRYYGISIGMGHIYQAGKNEIDVYGRYTFGHVGACDAKVGDNHYHFDSVKSHRVRVGGKYNFKLKDSNAKPFIGLAWEHEFKGESKASISGVGEAPAPSMKGHTGIMEVGCDWKVSKKWTLGLGANAYIGKRKGWDGMARVFYNF